MKNKINPIQKMDYDSHIGIRCERVTKSINFLAYLIP